MNPLGDLLIQRGFHTHIQFGLFCHRYEGSFLKPLYRGNFTKPLGTLHIERGFCKAPRGFSRKLCYRAL